MIQPRSPSELFEHFVTAASAAPHSGPRVDANKAVVQRYFEMWNSGDGSVADAVLGPTYLDHAHPEVIGPAAVRSLVPRFHSANPETRMTIAFAAADADFVAVRNTISRSLGGESVHSEGIALFRVVDGKLAEQWSCYPDVEAQRSPLAAARASLDVWLSFRA
jgi:predicted SnoaL-like aldol condensation-catalyzing enzyme